MPENSLFVEQAGKPVAGGQNPKNIEMRAIARISTLINVKNQHQSFAKTLTTFGTVLLRECNRSAKRSPDSRGDEQ